MHRFQRARRGLSHGLYFFTTARSRRSYTNESLPYPYQAARQNPAELSSGGRLERLFDSFVERAGAGNLHRGALLGEIYSDYYTVLEVGPRNYQTITIQAAGNTAPSIQWTSNPTEALDGQGYYIQALGSDSNGNLTQVNVWKQWSPFAFAGGGNGWNGYRQSLDRLGWPVDSIPRRRPSTRAEPRPRSSIIPCTLAGPTIAWEIAPATVNYQTWYTICARGTDGDGNMTTVNIYRDEQPFAFALNGSGSNAYPESAYCSSYSTVTYRAEALDSTGACSGSIYHTVHVANTMPYSSWNPTTINTFIGQAYTFSASGGDPDGNLQELRSYEYAWEDVSGTWVLRQNYQLFDTIASSGGVVSRAYTQVGGSF